MNDKDPPSENLYGNLPPEGKLVGIPDLKFKETVHLPEIPHSFYIVDEATKYEWKNIDDEEYRVYVFPCGCKVVIDHPLKLHVSESGGHRIFDSDGISHYIPPKWVHLFWVAKEGQPNFRF